MASVELQPHRSSAVKRARGFVRYATRSMRRRLTSRKTPAGMAANALFGEGHVILVDYPPTARAEPRYGYGRPPHPRLSELLGRGDGEYEGVLEEFKGYSDDLFAIPIEGTDPGEPRWRNGYLFGLDGVSLYCFTRKYAPRRYMEIGSGNSTLFVDRARRDGEIDMEIISVDPYPRREIDAICDSVVREPIETTNLDIFDGLQSGCPPACWSAYTTFTSRTTIVPTTLIVTIPSSICSRAICWANHPGYARSFPAGTCHIIGGSGVSRAHWCLSRSARREAPTESSSG